MKKQFYFMGVLFVLISSFFFNFSLSVVGDTYFARKNQEIESTKSDSTYSDESEYFEDISITTNPSQTSVGITVKVSGKNPNFGWSNLYVYSSDIEHQSSSNQVAKVTVFGEGGDFTTSGKNDATYSATVYKLNNGRPLTPGTFYQWSIKLDFYTIHKAEYQAEYPNYKENFTFRTLYYPSEAPIFEDAGVVTDIADTSATINYQIDQGNDKLNNYYNIDKVEVRDTLVSGELLGTDPTPDAFRGTVSGTVALEGLNPNTTYDNLILVAYYNDGSEQTITISVDDFTTLYTINAPAFNGTGTATDITNTSTIINYQINQGNLSNGDPYDIEKVEVRNISISGELLGIDTNPNGTGGTVALEGLNPNTTYDNLILVAYYNDGSEQTITISVDDFTTLYTVNAPTFNSTGTATDITNTSATIDYQINQGNLSNGDPYDIEKVEVQDGSSNVLGTDPNPNGTGGTVLLEGLNPNTTYDNLILVAYYNDGSEQTITTTIDSFFTSSERIAPTFSTTLIGTTTSTAQLQLTISDFGKDANGNPWTTDDLSTLPIIVDQDGNIISYNVLAITNNEENETSIIIELINLNSNTDYYNLTAIIYFNDGSGYGEYIFQNFAPDFSTASTVNNFLYFSIFLILGIVIVLVFIYLTVSYKKIN